MKFTQFKDTLQTFSSRILKRGEITYSEGDSPSSIYFIKNELIGLFHIAESGRDSETLDEDKFLNFDLNKSLSPY